MKVKNSKKRYIKIGSGQKIPFNIKRYYCANCNRIHTELSDFIQSYRQYEKSIIEEVQRGHIDTFSGDDSTIRYWQGRKK